MTFQHKQDGRIALLCTKNELHWLLRCAKVGVEEMSQEGYDHELLGLLARVVTSFTLIVED